MKNKQLIDEEQTTSLDSTQYILDDTKKQTYQAGTPREITWTH